MCSIFQWIRQKVTSSVQPKGSSPLKWWIIAALYFSIFGNAVSVQMLFAFLPDMVKSFGISDEDAGYYVGLLASSLYLGRFLSSYFWGWLCDKIGRRKVLLWCLALLAITTLSFGFAKSFAVAFIIRLLTGLAAGVAGTVKAALTDVCDETNQAFGMSLMVAGWNSGLIIGPALGGYLAKPFAKYPSFKKVSFFNDFAYLLPCLVNTILLVFSFLLVFFNFPETLASLKKKDKEAVPVSLNDCKLPCQTTADNSSLNRRRHSKNSQNETDSETTSYSKRNGEVNIHLNELAQNSLTLVPFGSMSFLNGDSHDFLYTSQSLYEVPSTYVVPNGKPKPGIFSQIIGSFRHSKFSILCRDKNVRYTVALYAVFSFAVVSENEMYNLWAASAKDLGGLSFGTNDLGFTLMVVGIGVVLSSCVIFPKLVKTFGYMKAQFLMLYSSMFFTIILPGVNILYDRDVALKVCIICILLIIRISEGCCFTGQYIFIGNSVGSHLRATVHGLSTSVICLARAVSPVVAGSLFSWSVSSDLGFPFNEKCVFIFLGLVFWLALVIACCLDPEAVTKRKD